LAQTSPQPGANASESASLQQQYDEAFQETLRQPANLDVLFNFATLAAKTGDLEGAVSALERMLVINPDIPRVRLELGVLYYRLGSYETARTYLETALASPALPPEQRERAEHFMADAQKRLSPSVFTGDAFFGWRYQSNANLGPGSPNVLLFGAPANLNQQATGQPDWGIVGSLQVNHSYDFGRQDKAALETQFTGYANRQFQLTTTDVSLLDLTTGPRFQILSETFQDVSLRPFIRGGYVWLNDTDYYGLFGGGLEGGVLLADRLRNATALKWSRQSHPDTWYLPANSQYTGNEMTAATGFQYLLTSAVTLFANGYGTRFLADLTPVQSYSLWGLGGGMNIRFADPLFKTLQQWRIGLNYAYQWWNYDAPDPTVDPNNLRIQLDSILSVTLAVPFDDRTTFTVAGGRFVRSSNIPNYAFENDTVMFGVDWRF